MRIAYVTTYDVLDRASWPKKLIGFWGAGYHLAQTLESQSIQVEYIGPLEKNYKLIHKVKKNLYSTLSKKNYLSWADPLVLKEYVPQIYRKLSNFNANVVLCPQNAEPVAYLECKQPIVLWTDAPIAASLNVYPGLSNLCNETQRHIYAMEKAALDRCQLLIFLSDWAAQTAIKTHKIDSSKIRVVPWGANIDCNRTHEDINSIVKARSTNICKLLFIGVDWFRKGGDTALEVAKELNNIGLKTELLVVGCQPITNEPLPSFVRTLGFVDKYTEQGLNQLNKLFCESHFLILPSKAETYGHVLCEANSFGIPCLATDVGGIPTIIKDDLNGKTFSLTVNISEYCTYIASLMTNYSEYTKLARSSFNEYQCRLNWEVVGKTAKQLIMELI
jgi:glycosyltransferase involved in cell wall biosynthesis